MTRLRQLGNDTVVYGLGAVLAKSIGFFLLPVYTRIFTPADYGTIEMLAVIASFLSAVLVMGMDSAQSFYFFQQKNAGRSEQARVVSAILQWRLTWGIGIVAIATLSAPVLNSVFFNGSLSLEYFAAAFSGALFMQIMSQSVEVFRLLYRPWPYVLITLAQTLMAAASILLLVLVFDQGVFGYFLGAMLASITTAALGWVLLRDYLDFSALHSGWWPRLLHFGAPLLPAGIAMYVMNTADRWFIQHYHGETALGLYAVGAKFSLLMAIAIETFRRAWWPIAMDAMHSDDGPETYRFIARLFIGFGVAAIVYLTFLSPWLVRWLTADPYYEAWRIVGVLAWQSVFFGFYMVVSAGLWKVERTRYSLYLTGGGAVVNIVLNWLLVPRFGAIGAASATAVSFLLWIIATMWVSERLWPIGFPRLMLATQVGVGALTVAMLTIFVEHSWSSVALVHLVFFLLLLSALDRKTWLQLRERLRAGV